MKKLLYFLIAILISASCQKLRCNNDLQDAQEEGIDCGGKCEPCQTCFDGIKNQDEVNVDCGGICDPCAIEYPKWGTYGLNILHSDNVFFAVGQGNSLHAIIPEGSSLKIELRLFNGDIWGYNLASNVGWAISTYEDSLQTFTAINGGTVDVNISRFTETGIGTIIISYFENGTSMTKQKVMFWK